MAPTNSASSIPMRALRAASDRAAPPRRLGPRPHRAPAPREDAPALRAGGRSRGADGLPLLRIGGGHQRVCLEKGWTGFVPPPRRRRAAPGGDGVKPPPFRSWLSWRLTVGRRASRRHPCPFFLAPETRGGGSDAIIEAFHQKNGIVRKRVAFVKGLVSALTLGSGGSGGREGPTMQMGGAIGSLVGQLLRVTERERRLLLVAGTAAGMAAVFRTPLGAALLAVEVLRSDGLKTSTLVPSVLTQLSFRTPCSSPSSSRADSLPRTRRRLSRATPDHLPLCALLALARLLRGGRHLLSVLTLGAGGTARIGFWGGASPASAASHGRLRHRR